MADASLPGGGGPRDECGAAWEHSTPRPPPPYHEAPAPQLPGSYEDAAGPPLPAGFARSRSKELQESIRREVEKHCDGLQRTLSALLSQDVGLAGVHAPRDQIASGPSVDVGATNSGGQKRAALLRASTSHNLRSPSPMETGGSLFEDLLLPMRRAGPQSSTSRRPSKTLLLGNAQPRPSAAKPASSRRASGSKVPISSKASPSSASMTRPSAGGLACRFRLDHQAPEEDSTGALRVVPGADSPKRLVHPVVDDESPGATQPSTATPSPPDRPVRRHSVNSNASRSSSISSHDSALTRGGSLCMWDMMMGPTHVDLGRCEEEDAGEGFTTEMSNAEIDAPKGLRSMRVSKHSQASSSAKQSLEDVRQEVRQTTFRASISSWDSDTDEESDGPVEGRYFALRLGLHLLRRGVHSSVFEFASALVIVANALAVGVQADLGVRYVGEAPSDVLRALEVFFCCLFATEVLMRLCAQGSGFFTKPREWRWNLMDFFVVSLQVCSEVMTIVSPDVWWGSVVPPGFFGLTRIVRLFRLMRVVRVLKLTRGVQEIRTMSDSIASSCKSLASTMVLLLLLTYIVGLSLTSLVAEHARRRPWILDDQGGLDRYYGTLARSILSLFQAITGGVDWNDILMPLLRDISPLVALPFVLYISFAILAMMNVITGVFVESALSIARRSKDAELHDHMRFLFLRTDKDGSGMICWEEFAEMLQDPEMAQGFQLLDIDPSEAQGLFTLLDTDCSGEIDGEEFVMGCLRLQGNAKAIDLATLMYFNKRISNWWHVQMGDMREGLEQIYLRLDQIQPLAQSDGRIETVASPAHADRGAGPPDPQRQGVAGAPLGGSHLNISGGEHQSGEPQPDMCKTSSMVSDGRLVSAGSVLSWTGSSSPARNRGSANESLASYATWAGLKAEPSKRGSAQPELGGSPRRKR